MICPNCGASNSTRATFCRRCRQRLPNHGLASGVTYPRRRNIASDTSSSRWAVYAAIFLAIVAFVVGAVLVGLSRPASPLGTFVAIATASAGPSLPPFEQPTPDPTPTPPDVATPTIEITPAPTDIPTPEITPTPTPTPPPTPRPTPAPTPTPAPFSCAAASGTPTNSVTVGTLQPTAETRNWCLETASFRFFPGSAYGTVRLMHNGQGIATFRCEVGQNCSGPIVQPVRRDPRLATRGDTLRFVVVQCVDPPETDTVNECEGEGVIATIEVGYEPATRP